MTQQSFPASSADEPQQPGTGSQGSGQPPVTPTPAYGSPAPAAEGYPAQSWGSPAPEQDPYGGAYGSSAGYGSPASTPEGHQIPTSSAGYGPVGGGSGRSKDVSFFAAMFDFGFHHFITVKFSSFLYVLAWIVALLVWGVNILFGIIWGFAFAGGGMYYEGPSFTPWPLIIAVLLGWIPSVIAIIVMRLGLEFSVATIRTAQNTEDLVTQQKG